jgi:phage I-like protein
MEQLLRELREVFGLKSEAQPDEIVAAAREKCAIGDRTGVAIASASPDPARYVAVAEFERALTELNSLKAERAHERASHAVEDAIRSGKLVPAQREWATAYCSADANGFKAFIAKQPSILGGETRLPAGPAGEKRVPMLTAAEIAICAQLGLKHSEFVGRKSGRSDFLSLNRGDVQGPND